MLLGIDVSTYLEQQRIASSKYYDLNHNEVNPFELFKKNGVTILRTRVWNNPYSLSGEPYLAGTCDLDNLIELNKKLKKYNFKNYVDFHYSDFWCDPSKQYLPKAWENLSFEELKKALYKFTFDSLSRLKDENIDVEYVSVGNEITHGFLWPFGKLNEDDVEGSFDRISELLKEGISASKKVFPGVKIIIHLEESYNQIAYKRYLNNILKRGVKFDILGTSYYPFWHHSFEEYFANMDMVQRDYKIPVMNVELGFPFTLDDYVKNENDEKKQLVINADNVAEFRKMMHYEISLEGQKNFVKDFLKLAKEHHLLGSCYWEPLWIPGDGICWASDAGQKYQHTNSKSTRNEWANQCLFDYDGVITPAFEEFKND